MTCRRSIEVQSIQLLLKVRFQFDQELIEQRVEGDNMNVFSFDSKSIEQRLGEIVVLSNEIEVSDVHRLNEQNRKVFVERFQCRITCRGQVLDVNGRREIPDVRMR